MKWKNVVKRLAAGFMAATMVVGNPGGYAPLRAQAEEKALPENTNKLRLWYTKPASEGTVIGDGGGPFPITPEQNIWQQLTLPIGNSYMGANVYGEVEEEHLTFNHKTLWDGGPSTSRPNYNGGNKTGAVSNGKTMVEVFKEVQSLFLQGKNSEASDLCNSLVGISDGYGAYQAFGDIYLNFGIPRNAVTNYVRDLNLENAIASVNFDYDNSNYNREFFISHPHNVLAMRFSATNGKKISFDVRFPANKKDSGAGAKNDTTVVDAGAKTITLKGSQADNQMKFNAQLKVVNENGTVAKKDSDKLTITDADSVVVYVSSGTDYKNDYPSYRTGETDETLNTRVAQAIQKAVAEGYQKIKTDHIADYQNIFSRVDLDLGQTAATVPTDELLAKYKAGTNPAAQDRNLEVLLFQYGRYLTVSSSREGDLPANLQGVWNNRTGTASQVPWGSDYHMNVNLQMNYWPTYSTNMAECAIPLIDYVESLREPGRVTAATYFGVESNEANPENGFTAHTQNTPFGWTCPGWAFSWGWSPAAVPWILQNCWEYYEYTGDKEFMRERIYPMLKEEAVLYDQILVEGSDGNLYSSPSYSPEHGPVTMGNTYEQSLIWQLYEDASKAAEILGVDSDKVANWKARQAKLNPIEIGTDGQIKEWREETSFYSVSGAQDGHRHMSHLLGLFPGDLISVDNAEYMDAAIVSLEERKLKSTGWGMGQRINAWARTGDGNKSHQLVKSLFNDGIFPNLWDSHAPFQIDGNFGMTSGVAEMLLQSNMDYINMLPSLPDVWANGKVDGLVARGNFEVGMTWNKGTISEGRILSKNGGTCTVQAENASLAIVKDELGKVVTDITIMNKNKISFPSLENEKFVLSFPEAEEKTPAPTNVKALRIGDKDVRIEWEAVEGADSYHVYRKVEQEDYILIGNSTKTSFTDSAALSLYSKIDYKVCAVVGEKEGILSGASGQPVNVQRVGFIDDNEKDLITYTGGWALYTADPTYKNTMHHVGQGTGKETIESYFVGDGIRVFATTNTGDGKFDVYIDGEKVDTADTYSSDQKFIVKVFEKLDLERGFHRIKLVATGEKNPLSGGSKIEFDAFEVLDSATVSVTGVTVDSKTGANVIGAANGTMQMTAAVAPENAANQKVIWSTSDEAIAAIDENGLLTAKETTGTVTVKATSADNGIVGTKEIQVQLAGVAGEENIRHDDTGIKYTGAGGADWDVWSQGTEAHWSKSVHFIQNANADGAFFEYTFNGIGIEVYGPLNVTFDSAEMYVDGNLKETVNLGTKDDAKQQLLFKSESPTDGPHTIKVVVKKRADKPEANRGYVKMEFDYFKVLKSSNIPDKAALQAQLQLVDGLKKNDYTTTTWDALQTAITAAVVVMNNATADAGVIASAATGLEAARTALAGNDSAPAAVTGLTAIGIEDISLYLTWDLNADAVTYQVYNGETLLSDAVTSDSYKVGNLAPNTAYTFKVIAVGKNGGSTPASVSATTLPKVDRENPTAPSNLKVSEITNTSMKISWEKAQDDIGVTGYRYYVDGVLKGETAELSSTITSLTSETTYSIRVIAVDASGKESLPVGIAGKTTGGEEVETYLVTLNKTPDIGGTVSGGGEYEEGADVTVTATANSGYHFVNWTENGTSVSTNASYKFKATKAVTLTAIFEKDAPEPETYTVTLNKNPEAGGTVAGGGVVEEGNEVTVSAVPASGYTFVNWTVNGMEKSKLLSYKFIVTSDIIVTANFKKNETPIPPTPPAPNPAPDNSSDATVESKPESTVDETDKTKTETTVTETKNSDGSTTTDTKGVETDKETGAKVETVKKETVDKEGNKVEESKVVKKDETGKVKEESATATVSDKTTGTVVSAEVKTDANGKVTSSVAEVTVSQSEVKEEKDTAEIIVKVPAEVLAKAEEAITRASGKKQVLELQVTIPSDSVKEQISKENRKEVIIKAIIPETAKDNKNYAMKSLIVKQDVVKAAKDGSTNIGILVVNETGKTDYSWSFKGESLNTSKRKVTDINLSLAVKESQQFADSVVVSFAHTGLLPASSQVKVLVGENQEFKPGDTAFFYYYNAKTKKLEEVPNNQYQLDKEGYAVLNVTHCSDYVLLPAKAEKTASTSLLDQIKVTISGKSAASKTLSLKSASGKTARITVTLPVTIEKVSKFNTSTLDKGVEQAKVSFTSTNKNVAAVSSTGKITAKKAGTATITTQILLENGTKRLVKTKITVK